MRRTHLAACAAILAMLVAAPAAVAKPPDVDSTRLERAVTVEGIHEHQKALQGIADLNGGNRYTRTPGYTASAAYVKSTLEKARLRRPLRDVQHARLGGDSLRRSMKLTSPGSKTYGPGSAADDGSPTVDFIAFEHSPTKTVTAEVVPVGHTDVPSDGGSTSGCVAADFPSREGQDRADPARHLRLHGEAAARRKGGRRRRDPLQRGRYAGREPALFRSADPGTRSRPWSPATRSARSSTTWPRATSTRRSSSPPTASTTSSSTRTSWPRPSAATRTTGARGRAPGLGPRRAGRQRRRLGHGVPARARRADRQGGAPRPATRSASCGSEARRTDWSARSTTPPTCPPQDVAKTDMMIDTDMIARRTSRGWSTTVTARRSAPTSPGPPAPARSRRCSCDYWAKRGMNSEPIPFDGRSDYVGFVNRGIPSGGVFAGAEAPKTAAAGRKGTAASRASSSTRATTRPATTTRR